MCSRAWQDRCAWGRCRLYVSAGRACKEEDLLFVVARHTDDVFERVVRFGVRGHSGRREGGSGGCAFYVVPLRYLYASLSLYQRVLRLVPKSFSPD